MRVGMRTISDQGVVRKIRTEVNTPSPSPICGGWGGLWDSGALPAGCLITDPYRSGPVPRLSNCRSTGVRVVEVPGPSSSYLAAKSRRRVLMKLSVALSAKSRTVRARCFLNSSSNMICPMLPAKEGMLTQKNSGKNRQMGSPSPSACKPLNKTPWDLRAWFQSTKTSALDQDERSENARRTHAERRRSARGPMPASLVGSTGLGGTQGY